MPQNARSAGRGLKLEEAERLRALKCDDDTGLGFRLFLSQLRVRYRASLRALSRVRAVRAGTSRGRGRVLFSRHRIIFGARPQSSKRHLLKGESGLVSRLAAKKWAALSLNEQQSLQEKAKGACLTAEKSACVRPPAPPHAAEAARARRGARRLQSVSLRSSRRRSSPRRRAKAASHRWRGSESAAARPPRARQAKRDATPVEDEDEEEEDEEEEEEEEEEEAPAPKAAEPAEPEQSARCPQSARVPPLPLPSRPRTPLACPRASAGRR